MTVIRRLVATLATLGLTSGLVTAAPTGAATADDPLGGLLDGLLGGSPEPSGSSTSEPTAADFADWGSFSVPRHKLRKGCHAYGYRYHVTPPSPDWALEVFLTDRRGRGIGSEAVLSGAAQTSGKRSFTICHSSTVPGRFLLRGKLTYSDYPDQHAGWITPKAFVMKAKKKRHHR